MLLIFCFNFTSKALDYIAHIIKNSRYVAVANSLVTK